MGNATINTTNDSKISQLKALLYLLQSNLEELKDEVDMSYELLKVGEKTELLKKLEEKINNPIEDLLQFSNTIDAQVRQILHKIIQGLFKKNSDIIDKVYKTRSSINDLHYSIVLREDTMENRNVLFDFLNKFDFDNLNQKHNIYFQFIPAHLIDKIKFSEELPLS